MIKTSKTGCIAVQDLVFLHARLTFHLRSVVSLRVAETDEVSGSFWVTCDLEPVMSSQASSCSFSCSHCLRSPYSQALLVFNGAGGVPCPGQPVTLNTCAPARSTSHRALTPSSCLPRFQPIETVTVRSMKSHCTSNSQFLQ